MKRFLTQILIVLLTVMFAAVAGAAGTAKKCPKTGKTTTTNFSANLSGGQPVPTVKTSATGKAVFRYHKDSDQLYYKITVNDIENVTAAHIHQGKKGKNGPPIVPLFSSETKGQGKSKKEGLRGTFSGVLAEGNLTDKDLMGSMSGKSLEDLVKLMQSGDTYVNVHTEAHPDGEIRGQIK